MKTILDSLISPSSAKGGPVPAPSRPHPDLPRTPATSDAWHRFFGREEVTTPKRAAASAEPDPTLRAARTLLKHNDGDLQALPPKLQRAILDDQKKRNEEGHKRMTQTHANAAPDEGPPSLAAQAVDGLKATGGAANGLYRRAFALDKVDEAQATERDLHQQKLDRFERRLAARDPREHARYKEQQARAERNIAADASPETWRRRDVERSEAERSRALLARDPDAWSERLDPKARARYEARQRQAMDSIQDSSAPDAGDRASVRMEAQQREREQLARDPGAWKASLPADRRRALEARQVHDDASIMASGMEAVKNADEVKDVLTFGAHSTSKREGAAGAAAELLTFGSYSLTAHGGADLGRASAYRDQAEQLRASGAAVDAGRMDAEADRLQLSGGTQVALGGVNLLLMKGAATAVIGRAGATRAAAEGLVAEGGMREAALREGLEQPMVGPAGGRGPWQFIRQPDGRFEPFRLVPGSDGMGDWVEQVVDGRVVASRQSADAAGTRWHEWIDGPGRFRVRNAGFDGLVQEARAQGSVTVHVAGPSGGSVPIQINGGATDKEVAALLEHLYAAPPAMRAEVEQISLTRRIGEGYVDGHYGTIDGLARNRGVVLDRDVMSAPQGRKLVYHEVGHLVDRQGGRISTRGPWGKGKSVSPYGETNAAEDFAEVHAHVIDQFKILSEKGKLGWMLEPCADKKAEILRLYGVEANRFTPTDLVLMGLFAGGVGDRLLFRQR